MLQRELDFDRSRMQVLLKILVFPATDQLLRDEFHSFEQRFHTLYRSCLCAIRFAIELQR